MYILVKSWCPPNRCKSVSLLCVCVCVCVCVCLCVCVKYGVYKRIFHVKIDGMYSIGGENKELITFWSGNLIQLNDKIVEVNLILKWTLAKEISGMWICSSWEQSSKTTSVVTVTSLHVLIKEMYLQISDGILCPVECPTSQHRDKAWNWVQPTCYWDTYVNCHINAFKMALWRWAGLRVLARLLQ
jgi:hypothetical protein